MLCGVCHRISTDSYHFILRPLSAADSYNGRIIRRSFGDRRGMLEGHPVCDLCSLFLCPRLQAQKKVCWNVAWPCFIWKCLSVEGYGPAEAFMRFLPESIRQSWLPSVNLWSESMRMVSNLPSYFTDITVALRRFTVDVESGALGSIIQQVNSTAFPRVRCPQGCYMFIDDLNRGKLQQTSAVHYLAYIGVNVNSFNADPNKLKGSRPDWAHPVEELDWTVTPALHVTAEYGICFLHCAKQMHASSEKSWVHVPTNPLLGTQAPRAPDIQAPVVMSLNTVRNGRTNAQNTSFPVYEQNGSTQGLSTFHLSLKHPSFQMNDDLALGMALVYDNRKDILHLAKQSPNLALHIQPVMEFYQSHANKPSPDVVDQHRLSGTYIDVEDGSFLAQAYNGRISNTDGIQLPNGDRLKIRSNPKDCSVIVHPSDSAGHCGFKLGSRHRNDLGEIAHGVLSVFVHSSQLLQILLHSKWDIESRKVEAQTLVLKAVSEVRFSSPSNPCTFSHAEKERFRNLLTAPDNLQVPERKIAACIADLCFGVHVAHGLTDAELSAAAATVNANVFILTRDPVEWDAPLSMDAGEWIMLLGLTSTDEFLCTYRWTPDLLWHFVGTSAHEIPAREHAMVIYVRQYHLEAAKRNALQLCSGQGVVTCLQHDILLIRQPKGAQVSCAVFKCKNRVHWRCAHGFGQDQCCVGLCRKHFENIMDEIPTKRVHVGIYGPPQLHDGQRRDIISAADSSDEEEIAEADVDFNQLFLEANDLHGGRQFPVDDLGHATNDAPIPMTTSVVNEPRYMSESSTSTAGHFFLNPHLRVMSRTSVIRKPPVALQQILQNICSKVPDWCIPLVYPEAMLFPRIFWAMNGSSVVGALCSAMFSSMTDNIAVKNVAPLRDHMLVRLQDSSLLTSHDMHYIQFAFDVLLNADLNRNSAVVACHRGLEAVVRKSERFNTAANESILKFDEGDARREVNRLVSMLRTEGAWNYFITLTCNDSKTFGVAPIRRAILKIAQGDETILNELLQNYCVILTRAWERTAHYIWKYITTSDEKPVGNVKSSWMRFEFQSGGALGNRPHIHGGITLHDEPLEDTLSRVRCSHATMWSETCATDQDTLLRDGIVKSDLEYSDLMDSAAVLQQHNCQNANERCRKRKASDGSFVCRVLRHPPSFEYHFEEHGLLYDEDLYRKLEYLDLAYLCACGKWNTPPAFKAGLWHYPAQASEHFVPTIPRIFVAMQSSTNVQVCDRKFQVSYLAKYAAGQDERKQASFSPSTENNQIRVDSQNMINIKISGQRLHPLNERQKTLARELPLTESIWYALRFPYVVSSCDFVHVSTKPPEYRTAIMKRTKMNVPHAPRDGGGGVPDTVMERLPLAEWRRFSESQTKLISNYVHGKFCLDQTSSFSIRPPELTIISELELYSRWFTWTHHGKTTLVEDLQDSNWVDGAQRTIRIRSAHVGDVANHVHRLTTSPDDEVRAQARELFAMVIGPVYMEHRFNAEGDKSPLYERYVDRASSKRTVVVFPNLSPSYFPNFLVHLLLTMGRFVSEDELYSAPSLAAAFERAQIFQSDEVSEADIKALARRYVTDQLLWLPVGSRTFARRLKDVLEGLFSIFGTLDDAELPLPLLYDDDITRCVQDEFRQLQVTRRNTSIDVLQTEQIANFPPIDDLRRGQAHFQPVITPAPGQTPASENEQRNALSSCVATIDNLTGRPRSVLLIGPPGCGKTHILLIVNTYVISKNLHTTLVAITSERARRLGGEHLHMMFCIPVEQVRLSTVASIASRAILSLTKAPLRLAILQRLQVLLFEEVSLLSAEMLATIDVILRMVRNNDHFLGGVLLIGTGDPCQLSPVDGSPLWASHHMISSFRIIKMEHLVRARHDDDLQRLISILRTESPDPGQCEHFETIIRDRCIPRNCVPSWRDVPADVLRIVGTKAACEEIINEMIQQKKADPTLQTAIRIASDEAEVGSNGWATATEAVRKTLDRLCLEPRELVLYKQQILRLTYNNPRTTGPLPVFSQGQCCIVQNLPTTNNELLWVKLVPVGHRQFDPATAPAEWPVFSLKPAPSPVAVVSAGKTKARRTQFRVTYFVCSTVHRALGETCHRIATSVSVQNSKYRLWDKKQLLVLISRVPTLDNIIFVTDNPDDSVLALIKLLQQPCLDVAYSRNLIDTVADPESHGVLHHPHDCNITPTLSLPNSDVGYVYMIVSINHPTFAYVGETVNIARRLREHNTGHGSDFTRNPYLMPWTCFVLVSGFGGQGRSVHNTARRKAFEAEWHRLNGLDVLPSTRTIYNNGRIVFNDFRRRTIRGLLWQQFGNPRDD